MGGQVELRSMFKVFTSYFRLIMLVSHLVTLSGFLAIQYNFDKDNIQTISQAYVTEKIC